LRKEQQNDIISELVKNRTFWEGEANWNKASYTEIEQREFLKKVSDISADAIGMRRVRLTLYEDPMKKTTNGRYYWQFNRVEINKTGLEYKYFYPIISTVIHETAGHSYQDYVMETKEEFLKDYPYLKNQVEIFKYSFDGKMWPSENINYNNIYGNNNNNIEYIIYRNDPKEIDAFNMGDIVEEGVKSKKEEFEKFMKSYFIQTRNAVERIKEYESQNK
jgi:hypothetical protein